MMIRLHQRERKTKRPAKEDTQRKKGAVGGGGAAPYLEKGSESAALRKKEKFKEKKPAVAKDT